MEALQQAQALGGAGTAQGQGTRSLGGEQPLQHLGVDQGGSGIGEGRIHGSSPQGGRKGTIR